MATSAYTNFFISPTGKDNVELYYGNNKAVNMIEGRTYLKKLNSDFNCEGMLFTVQNQLENEKKLTPGSPFSRVKCNDGRIIELKWKENNTVEGIDQFDKSYSFIQAKKKEYKNYIKTNTINEKDSKL